MVMSGRLTGDCGGSVDSVGPIEKYFKNVGLSTSFIYDIGEIDSLWPF